MKFATRMMDSSCGFIYILLDVTSLVEEKTMLI